MKQITILLLAILAASTVNAQVASPSLNPSVYSGTAAASWRKPGTALSLHSLDSKGKVSDSVGEAGEAVFQNTAPGIGAAIKGDTWAFELDLSGTITNNWNNDNAGLTNKGSIYQNSLSTSYLLGETLSLGLGYLVSNHSWTLDLTNPIPVTMLGESTNKTIRATASWKVGEIFFIGGGIDSTTNDKGSTIVTNSFISTLMGLGVVIGQPGDTQFRLDYQTVSTPKTIAPSSGTLTDNTQNSVRANTVELEAKFGNFLFGYKSDKSIEGTNYMNTSQTEISLGWIPMDGITVSLGKYSRKLDMNAGLPDQISVQPEGWRLSLGWIY